MTFFFFRLSVSLSFSPSHSLLLYTGKCGHHRRDHKSKNSVKKKKKKKTPQKKKVDSATVAAKKDKDESTPAVTTTSQEKATPSKASDVESNKSTPVTPKKNEKDDVQCEKVACSDFTLGT